MTEDAHGATAMQLHEVIEELTAQLHATDVARLRAEDEAKKWRDEALETAEDMVRQNCASSGDSTLDSMAISTYADAMRLLAEHGRLRVTAHYGRRVIGVWAPRSEWR